MARKYEPIKAGEKYGEWYVIAEVPRPIYHRGDKDDHFFKCECSCGESRVIMEKNLRHAPKGGCNRCAKRSQFQLTGKTMKKFKNEAS